MHPNMRKVLLSEALLACLLAAGCERAQQTQMMPTPQVAVVTVKPEQVVLTSELPGRTCSYLVAEIRPQVNGLLKKRLFTEGADVKAGDVLYEIDPAPYQAAVDSAAASFTSAQEAADQAEAMLQVSEASLQRHKAVLSLAKTNLQRYENLVKTHAASAMQRDQADADVEVADSALRAAEAQVNSNREAVNVAKAAIKQAKAALKTAQINLGYTKIVAPISGRIGRSSVTEGAIVTAYQPQPMATIQQLDPIYVDVPQATKELYHLRRSLAGGCLKQNCTNKVKIVMEDDIAEPLEGTLEFRDITVDPTTGSVILRIVVPNPDNILLPGMFVKAIIDEGVKDSAILVPQQAVSRDPKGTPLALVVDDKGKVQQRVLSTDRAIGDKWLVSSGLAPGDRVIVEGMQKARPGIVVDAVPFEAKSATNGTKPVSTAQAATKLK